MNNKANTEEKSKSLIIHCHGGGWFTQSSKFREKLILVKSFKLLKNNHFRWIVPQRMGVET
jgi:hypothetical protein